MRVRAAKTIWDILVGFSYFTVRVQIRKVERERKRTWFSFPFSQMGWPNLAKLKWLIRIETGCVRCQWRVMKKKEFFWAQILVKLAKLAKHCILRETVLECVCRVGRFRSCASCLSWSIWDLRPHGRWSWSKENQLWRSTAMEHDVRRVGRIGVRKN